MTEHALSTTVIDRGSGTAIQQLQERMRTVLEVMANVLEEGKDYGRIPGTDKPTLYKPGAEKLMLTFNLAPAEPKIEDLSTADEIRYRVGVPIEGTDGRQRWGIGEASSNEEKYRWRKPVCDEEFADTPEHLRREKWFKGKDRPYKGKQIRTSPADVANTILKMAHKRGFIHGTLLATGASSVFNQDLEDFTKEMQDAIVEADETTAPKKTVERASASSAATKPAAAPNGNLVTEPRKVKAVRGVEITKGKHAGKTMYVLELTGDKTEYTTYDVTLAKEAESFVGTDHLVQVGYEARDWQGKTYYNAKTLAIADAEPAPPTGASVDQSQIPFAR
jgi:hypothetical protein